MGWKSVTPQIAKSLQFISQHYSPGQAALVAEAASLTPEETIPDDGTEVMLPYAEGKQPRLTIFGGLPTLKWLSLYCNSQFVRENIRGIIIIENNKQKVCNLLNDPNFIKFANSPIIRFILCPGIQHIKSMFFNVLKEPEFSRVMKSAMFFPHDQAAAEDRAVYDYAADTYEETLFHVFHNYGRIDDSLLGVKATLLNKNRLLTEPGLQELKDTAKGLPAVIVGAGPSLDHNIELLAKNKDKFVIIAVDAAVKPLLKYGIEPHFTTSIERGNIYQKPFWEGLPKIKTQLVYFPVVHPEVLDLYPGPKRPVYRNYTYYAYFEYSWPKGIMHSGGSTSHLANRLAFHLGVKEIIYVGLDNCYEKHSTEDSYRSHCNGLGYEEWAGYYPIEYFNQEKNHAPSYKVTAFDGSEAVTNVTYHQWAKEFEEEVLVLGLAGRVYHTNPKAVNITGVKYESFETICNSLEPIEITLNFEKLQEVPKYRVWDNSHILKSFKGWASMASLVAELCDFNLDNESDKIKATVIATLFDVLDRKFTRDKLFISFIVQNCAAEYYQNLNDWYSLPNDLSKDFTARLTNIRERAKLYLNVLEKLIKIFEEEENEQKTN